MIKITTAFKEFIGKDRNSVLNEFVHHHAMNNKVLSKIKSVIENGEEVDEDALEDYQIQAEEFYDEFMGVPSEDEEEYLGNLDAQEEAMFLKGGR